MIIVKSIGTELRKEKTAIMAASFSMGVIFIKFADGIEITLPFEGDNNVVNRVLSMVKQSTSKNITLDLTRGIENLISFG
jgi:hypothetical protein